MNKDPQNAPALRPHPWWRIVWWSFLCGVSLPTLLFVLFLFYWILGNVAKNIGIPVPANLAVLGLALGLSAIVGAFTGVLTGFAISRKDLGHVQQYLFLVVLGSAVPVAGSLLEYNFYKAKPSEFSFDERIQNALGRRYSLIRQTEIAAETQRLHSVIETLRAVIAGLAGRSSATYLDPLGKWGSLTGCRRMNLTGLSDRFCIERRIAYTKFGRIVSYWPVIHLADAPSGSPDYTIDSVLLTGPYRCPVEQDIFMAGGLTLFKTEAVNANDIRTCFGVAAAALNARVMALANEKKLFDSVVVMPYWYFLFSSLYAFVGASSFAMQPLGFWPTFIDASLVVFRFVYLGVLVTTWVDNVRSKG